MGKEAGRTEAQKPEIVLPIYELPCELYGPGGRSQPFTFGSGGGRSASGAARLRVMVATQQQMNDAQLPLEQRDYCAHYLIKLMKCKRDNFPNFLACQHERHEWDYCEHLDYVMRMKEFERERRLLVRKKRLEQEAAGA
nr:NADH dehydrogenase [ubiquinone] 1 beta subcomplex subunit 7 isoform X1 [Chelonoidis abingdonii]